MNFIGLDISLNSTAVFIQNNDKSTILSFTNKKDNNIYIRELEQCGVKFYFIPEHKKDVYSKNEALKIGYYDSLSDEIISGICSNIEQNERTYCQIEGYSYSSSNTISLLDIVALSTLIRYKLLKTINNIEMSVIPPSSLKKAACGLVYGYDKKGNTKNNEGISGGHLKKNNLFQAIIDGSVESPILSFLKNYSHLTERKKIPNPIDDIIDAIFCCKVKQQEIENIS